MGVELVWLYDSSTVEEPFSNTAETSYTFTLQNNGTSHATSCGFYLKPASTFGDNDNPSSNGVLQDWYDALDWGETPGQGFIITQGGVDTEFNFTEGDSAEAPIMLTVGTGASGDNISPGESVTLSFKMVPPAGTGARRLYVEVEMTYVEV